MQRNRTKPYSTPPRYKGVPQGELSWRVVEQDEEPNEWGEPQPGDEVLKVIVPDEDAPIAQNEKYQASPPGSREIIDSSLAEYLKWSCGDVQREQRQDVDLIRRRMLDLLDPTSPCFHRTLAGDIIRKALEVSRCDQQAFALAANRSPATVSKILHGKQDPSLTTLLRLLCSSGFELTFTLKRKLDHPGTRLIDDLMIATEDFENTGGWSR